jgi:hypothetical protein
MKFELEFFDEFVRKECRKNKDLSPSTIISDFVKKKNLVQSESERIKKNLRTQVFEIENESRIELFIQAHQSHIIRLANKVAKEIDKSHVADLSSISAGYTKLNLCKIILKTFEELLTYIETHFSKYFDQDQIIPDTYALISAQEFQEKIERIKSLFDLEKVDQQLGEIILFPISEFIESAHGTSSSPDLKRISFRQLIYMKYLLRDILHLEHQKNHTYKEALYDHLFYLNFNNYHFINYETTRIRNHVEELPSLASQIEYLSYVLKKLYQVQVKPSFSLKPNRESLRNLLSNWLEQEITFIEKKRQLTLMISPGGARVAEPDTFKVKTSLSVAQLAYSVRLLKESGIIVNDNKAEVIRFFSKHFSSVNNQNISQESFRSKYFGFETSAVTSIQGILNKMISISKKDE